jgi:hypothetical protein
MSREAFAENRGADADHSRAFFNGYFEIVCHTHRELALPTGKCTPTGKLVSELS